MYYGVGFVIGTAFVVLFFENRGCSWLPQNRVKGSLVNKMIVISEKNRAKFPWLKSEKDFIQFTNESEVDFERSQTHADHKVYLFTSKKHKLYLVIPKDAFVGELIPFSSTLSKVRFTKKGYGEIIVSPKEKDFLFVQKKASLNCHLKQLNWDSDEFVYKLIRSKSKFNFGASNMELKLQKMHALEMKIDTNLIAINAIWYKDKMNIVKINSSFSNLCH
ncbi:MAG: hypothetical protein EB100_05395 [Crocinitomicaceae bacterium]|nr:hypothetical protein [Crocinitomicaceae bacterium]